MKAAKRSLLEDVRSLLEDVADDRASQVFTEKLAERADALLGRLDGDCGEVLAALGALVAGVEDSVLRFLDSHELALRPDMDAVLRDRVSRARAILAAIEGGQS